MTLLESLHVPMTLLFCFFHGRLHFSGEAVSVGLAWNTTSERVSTVPVIVGFVFVLSYDDMFNLKFNLKQNLNL